MRLQIRIDFEIKIIHTDFEIKNHDFQEGKNCPMRTNIMYAPAVEWIDQMDAAQTAV